MIYKNSITFHSTGALNRVPLHKTARAEFRIRSHLRWDVVAASASSSSSTTTVSAMDPTGSYFVRTGHHYSL